MTLANHTRQGNLPRRVLVSDPLRQGDVVALAGRLTPGSGILLRHYGHPERGTLALTLARLARRRRLLLIVAADWRLAARAGAAGIHLPEAMARHGVLAPLLGWRRRRGVLLTVAAHSPAALARARRLRADAALLSPVFPTASHPGAAAIGPVRFALWARRAGLAVLALGGMTRAHWPRLRAAQPAGWAAVGAFGKEPPRGASPAGWRQC